MYVQFGQTKETNKTMEIAENIDLINQNHYVHSVAIYCVCVYGNRTPRCLDEFVINQYKQMYMTRCILYVV